MQDHTASSTDVSTAVLHEQGKDDCLLNSQDMQARSAYASTACDSPDTEHNGTPDLQSTQYAPNMDNTGELVTMSQEYLYKHNIGVTRALNANLFKISVSEPPPLHIKTNIELYKQLCNTSKSYQHLITRVANSVVSQHIWLRKARDALKRKKYPDKVFEALGEITFQAKIQWLSLGL